MAFPNQSKPSPGNDKGKQGVSRDPVKDHGKDGKQQKTDQPGKTAQSDPHKQRTPQ